MFQVTVNPKQNVLVMMFVHRVVPEEMKKGQETVKALLKELTPGFRLLSDLSGLETMDPACLPYISKNMDLMSKHGVAKVVRVIPDPHKDIGLNIMSLFHYPRGIQIVTCATLKEAMTALEE